MSEELCRRLRGEYRTPITDDLGPAGGAEPNNPNEFVRRFETPPIQHEAAIIIEQQAARIAEFEEQASYVSFPNNPLRGDRMYGLDDIDGILTRAEAAEAEVKRLRKALEEISNGTNMEAGEMMHIAHITLATQESRHD